ncbi:hypothetical protein CLOM_g4378 [Closterium sp. NIES-68]|nr:hypothetical protein CLOM_g4378 [Closterium sp. NIES-68]GJP86936.1 hypothetical protein CLOP_g16900 [Closterium sp. NIES-67]
MANIHSLWNDVTSFFSPADTLPWTDEKTIQACERDVLDPGQAAASRDNLMKLAWALVHSRREADVVRGIAMLDEQLRAATDPQQRHEALYLKAVGCYRAGDLQRARQLVEDALKISPTSHQAARLKTCIESKIASDGVIGVGIAASAVAVIGAVAVAAIAGAAGGRK